MDKIFEEMKKYKIVPVIVIDDAEDAENLSDALCEGGIPVAEVTFRTEAAEEKGAGRQGIRCRSEIYRYSGTESGNCPLLSGAERAGLSGSGNSVRGGEGNESWA